VHEGQIQGELPLLFRQLLRRGKSTILSWEESRFDRGLEPGTGGTARVTDLTIPSGEAADGHAYVAEHPRLIALWMRMIADPTMYTMVDLGSGKGRVLVAGARAGFRKVIGVEYATELHEAALSNTTGFRGHGSPSIDLVLGDAGAYRFPLEPLVVHFNNPFREPTMSRVIDNLSSSYEELPRPIVVVYQQARVEDDPTRNVELLQELPFLDPRPVERSIVNRLLLRSWRVDLFATPAVPLTV
jgi:hypothetical protein